MNNEVKSDKSKIIGLIFVIICVVILIIGFFIIAILDLTSKVDSNVELSTTTRRSINTANPKQEETTNSEIFEEEPTTTIVTETNENEVKATNVSVVTKARTTTTVISESSNDSVIENKPNSSNRTIVTDETTFTDAINTYEWDIVNYINEERKKNGLSEVKVAKELRDLAEGGANEYCVTNSDSSASAYLSGYTNYRSLSYRSTMTSLEMFNKVKNSTKVTTSSLSYVGVGVIYKSCSYRTPGYYFVLIYE